MRNTMLAVLMVVGLVVAQIPTAGLAARYDFTGGALTDGSGNGRTLTRGSTGATQCADRDMFPNNAYLFEGSLSGYFYRAETGMPVGNSDRTICFWIALAEKDDSLQQVLAWGIPRYMSGDTSNGFRLAFANDTLCIQQKGTQYAKAKVKSSDFPAPGNWDAPWVHVALVIESSSARWYINGTLLKEVAFNELATSASTSAYLIIGNVGTRYLKGKLDEVLIYNRALTDAEVLGVFEPQVSVTAKTTTKRIMQKVDARNTYLIDGRLLRGSPRHELVVTRMITR